MLSSTCSSRACARIAAPRGALRRALQPHAGVLRRVCGRPAPAGARARSFGAEHAASASKAHSLTNERLEVVKDLDRFARTELLSLLKPPEKCWQPSEWLPSPESPDFLEQAAALQRRTGRIPDELLVCLVGDMITEEALPTYMSMINSLDGVRDETGSDDTPWATWTRAWTAEEKRHGEALGRYLWLTGRVNGKAIDITIQKLISAGMAPGTENNPYMGFIYTSFQERATKVAHGNTARIAKEFGDETLAKLCGLIAADEGRHEVAYQRIVDELAKRDPAGVVLALAAMMRRTIVMPAHNMDDGQHAARSGKSLFDDYAAVADRIGVYTAFDYADIMEHVLQRWGVGSLRVGETGEAADAQQWLMAQPTRVRRLAEVAATRRARAARAEAPPVTQQFSWVFDRPVMV